MRLSPGLLSGLAGTEATCTPIQSALCTRMQRPFQPEHHAPSAPQLSPPCHRWAKRRLRAVKKHAQDLPALSIGGQRPRLCSPHPLTSHEQQAEPGLLSWKGYHVPALHLYVGRL